MTKGSVAGSLILFATPILVSDFLQQCYNVVDSLIVGNYVSKQALAAVGETFFIINIFLGIFLGISLGSTVEISNAYGAKDRNRLSRAVDTTLKLTLILSIVFTIALACGLLKSFTTSASSGTTSSVYTGFPRRSCMASFLRTDLPTDLYSLCSIAVSLFTAVQEIPDAPQLSLIAGAAAQIAGNALPDLFLIGVVVFIQQRQRREDHARAAEAALQRTVLHKGFLELMHLFPVIRSTPSLASISPKFASDSAVTEREHILV